MTMPLVLVAVMVVLYACGVYLMLDRTLTRILLGFLLVGNATNLLIFLMSGGFGVAPLHGNGSAEEMSDPLPQAFILTAIVITFGVSAFLLALIYRSWRLVQRVDETEGDSVVDDAADLEISFTEALTADEVLDGDLEVTPETADDVEVTDDMVEVDEERRSAQRAAAALREQAARDEAAGSAAGSGENA